MIDAGERQIYSGGDIDREVVKENAVVVGRE